jgi:hypothetical protein
MLATAAVVTAMIVGVAGAGLAQDATPAAMEAHPSGPFPNHLHAGSCDNLDPAPAVTLADLQFPEWVASMAGEETEVEVIFPDPESFGNAPIPVAVATTEVPVPLADIIAGKHALNVHNPADPADYVACGNIGGIPDARGDLFVGLESIEDSGFDGVVWFHDNGASTTVVVFLSHPAAQGTIAESLAAMAATAAEEEAAATPVAPAATPEVEAAATPVA